MGPFGRLLVERLGADYPVDDVQIGRLEKHFDLLQKWNQRTNLTSIRDPVEVIERHYCESIALAHTLPLMKQRVMDAGSGAGFPGIPIAIIRGNHYVYLVDADVKKSVFLREASIELPNCRVLRMRLEQVTQECDWMVVRAIHYRDILPHAERLADHVALLITEAGVGEISARDEFLWEDPKPLPWGDRRVILRGHRRGWQG